MKRNRSAWRLWRRVFRPDPGEEIDTELEYHVEQRIRDYISQGMDPETARRAALQRLGDVERFRAECVGLLESERRVEERRSRLRVSWLDVKLGLRMLAKYPGLSVVAVIGMAIAIAIGAGYFGAYGTILDSSLPMDEGDRVVILRNLDTARPPGVRSNVQTVHDYVTWRDESKSVADIAAYRTDNRNLITEGGRAELVEVAAMSAAGFRVARIAPIMGRPLLDEDERVGAPPVVVIAYDEWQRLFEGDPAVLGQSVLLGQTVHTIIGVMPAGFRFPIRHRYWVPLRLDPSDYGPGLGPALTVFGRLANGFTLRQARSELETIGSRMADAYPETHERYRARVQPFTHDYFNIDGPEMALALRAVQIAISLLLVIVAVNVAMLVYARTVTRTGEIAVRSALGASRRRIVTQLFMEALVMSSVAAVIGLTIAAIALGMFNRYIKASGESPYWIEFGLTPGIMAYVAVLAFIAAGIVGVLPALKATGKRVHSNLQQLSTRGSAHQLGGTWTVLIVVQVAVAVAALPAAINYADQSARMGTRDPASAATRLLRTSLRMTAESTSPPGAAADAGALELAGRARYSDRAAEVIRRLAAEPEVSSVTFASRFPGLDRYAPIEVDSTDGVAGNTVAGEPTGMRRRGGLTNRVAINLFDVFEVPIQAGRGFVAADTRDGATAVIVNEAFAHWIAGGANVLGRRVRYVRSDAVETEEGPWFEIVGVVPDFEHQFTTPSSFDKARPRLYHARSLAHAEPITLAVRIREGSAGGFAARLRDIAAAVDPTLTLDDLQTVVGAWNRAQQAFFYLALGIIAVSLSVLLLSAAGIYAMMSFTVARRRREIGIRSALGADPRRILTDVFARASAQLGAGVLAGLLVAVALDRAAGGIMGGKAPILLPAVSVLMLAIGLVAALGPARRGLAVQPTEALREE